VRARTIAVALLVFLGASGFAALAVDRLSTTDVEMGASEWSPSVVLHCTRHPVSAPDWWAEAAGNAARPPSLPGPGPLEPPDGRPGWTSPGGVWDERRREWSIVLLDDEPRRCSDDAWLDETPEWLEPEPPEPAEGESEGHEKTTARYGIGDLHDNPDPHMARLLARDRHRHEGVLAPGSIEPDPVGYCLLEAATGLRWCAEAEAALLDRAVVPDVALVEVLDLAPRVLCGRSLATGELLWRTVVPEPAQGVWLVRAMDGGLGVRANEDYFSLEPATGELVRVTPEGAELCSMRPLVIAVGGGVVGATLEHPARFVELGRAPVGATLASCAGDVDRATVVVSAPPVEGALVTEPAPLDAASGSPEGGAALYVVGADATLAGAWSVPWARSITLEAWGAFALTNDGSVRLDFDANGLRLAGAPDAGPP
jgi:hypothetical protein